MKKLVVIATLVALVGLAFIMPANVAETNAGGYFQSLVPVVYEDMVITGMGSGGLHVLNLDSGSKVWSIDTTDHVYSSPELDEENGKIYVVLATDIFPYRHIHKIDAKTGSIEWKMPITKGVFGQPLYKNGYVVVPTTGVNAGKGTIEVYNSDGEFLWNYWFGGWVTSKPLIIGEDIIVGSFFGEIEILKIESGKKSRTWKKPFKTYGSGPYAWDSEESPGNRNGAAVECDLGLFNGYIYFGSYDSLLYKVNAEDGTMTTGFEVNNSDWMHGVTWSRSRPLLYDGNVYVGSQSKKDLNGLYKFEDESWEKLGFYETGSETFVGSSPVEVNGNIIFGTDDGRIICLDTDLDEVWKTNVSHQYISNRPAIVDGKLIYTARRQIKNSEDEIKVLCLNADDGEIIWEKNR